MLYNKSTIIMAAMDNNASSLLKELMQIPHDKVYEKNRHFILSIKNPSGPFPEIISVDVSPWSLLQELTHPEKVEGNTTEKPLVYVNILPFDHTYLAVSIRELCSIPKFVEELANYIHTFDK